MKKKLAILVSMLLLTGLFAACGGSENGSAGGSGGSSESTAQTLVVHHLGDPLTMNPDTTGDDYNYNPSMNIFNRLVKLDYSQQVAPDLAESWEISEDGKTITFHLRDNAKWHDGEDFTSEDVKFTYEALSTDSSLIAHNFFTDITEITCPDDNTAVFTLANPNAGIIGNMAWYGVFIMPKHLYDNGQPWADNEANANPIGTGPFKFEKYTPGVSIDLVKNEDYWDGAPKLDRLVYKIIPDVTTAVQALRTGEIDFMHAAPNNEVESLESEGFSVNLTVYPSPMYLLFNFREDHETPLAVRQAIALCIDREDITNKVFGGVRVPEYNFYPSLIEWASNKDAAAPAYNIQEAVKLLEDSGLKKDADGFYVRDLQIECYADDNAPDVSKLIAAACAEAGIDVKVNSQEYLAWDQTVNELSGATGDFSIALMGGNQGPDPTSMVARFGTGGTSNLGKYSNTELDACLTEAKVKAEQSERQALYFKAQQIMRDEMPIIPIVGYAEYQAGVSKLKGLPKDEIGRAGFAEFAYTYFE